LGPKSPVFHSFDVAQQIDPGLRNTFCAAFLVAFELWQLLVIWRPFACGVAAPRFGQLLLPSSA